MSQQHGPVPSADNITFFKGGEADVEQQEIAALTEPEKTDLVFVLTSLWKHPEQTVDVRGRRGPVRAISYNGSLWVFYCVHTHMASSSSIERSIVVEVLRIERLEEASSECPEAALDMAMTRWGLRSAGASQA